MRCSSSRRAACGSACPRGSQRPPLRRPSMCRSRRWRNIGMGSTHPTTSCSAGPLAANLPPTSTISRPSAPSCWRIRWRKRWSISPTTPQNGNGTVSASSWCARATRPGSIPVRATIFRRPSPNCSMCSPSPRCSTANCWSAAMSRAAPRAARRASMHCNSGSGAKPSARRCSSSFPPSFGSTTAC